MQKIIKPVDYPMSANSGIFDAQRFSFEGKLAMHIPASYPDANKVTALCGAYGWVVETDSRVISWASGYVEGQHDCPACANRA